MPFRLRLTFNGLCFFVRDHGQAMHVLLPATDGVTHIHNGMTMVMPRHYGRIYYDTAHRTPGNSREAGVLAHEPFERVALDLSSAGVGGVGALPPEIPDVIPGRRIAIMLRNSMAPNDPGNPDPNNPNTGGPDRVLARVTMRAGSIACTEPGAYCTDGNGSNLHRVTNRAVWVIENVPGSALAWHLAGLDGGPAQPVPTLHPIPKKNGAGPKLDTIDLFICNLVREELPPEVPAQPALNVRDPAMHYHHFFRLYRNPGPSDLPLYFSLAGGASCSGSAFSAQASSRSHACSGAAIRTHDSRRSLVLSSQPLTPTWCVRLAHHCSSRIDRWQILPS